MSQISIILHTILYTTKAHFFYKACAIPLKHENQPNAAAEIQAMDSLRALGQQSGLGAFPYAFRYGVWEGNRVRREVFALFVFQ